MIIAEAGVDIVEFERLLNAKVDPLIETIKELKSLQVKQIEIMRDQSRMTETLVHLQKCLDDHIQESNVVRNEIFGRLREMDKNSECKEVHKELSEQIADIKDNQGDKVWDVVKLIVAGAVGWLISWGGHK